MRSTENILVTAGATRNPIDAVRFISARSSGRTGAYLADKLVRQGGEVTLLGSPEACMRVSSEVKTVEYGSTRDLMVKMNAWALKYPHGTIIHASAVGDYEVIRRNTSKISSGQKSLTIELQPTPKIASAIRSWGFVGVLVTFKAAAPEVDSAHLIRIATAQRGVTQSDFVFANVLGKLESKVAIIGEQTVTFDSRKNALRHLVELVTERP